MSQTKDVVMGDEYGVDYNAFKNNLDKLSLKDHSRITVELMRGLLNTLAELYEKMEYGKDSIGAMVEDEGVRITNSIKDRVDKNKVEPWRTFPTDDQFENDSTIDMNILMSEVSKTQ